MSFLAIKELDGRFILTWQTKIFCQVWLGTEKYLSAPVATTSYSTQMEMPVITICHGTDEGKFGSEENFAAYFNEGNFLEDGSNLSAEDLYQQRTDQNYFMLDGTGTTNIQNNPNNIKCLL